MQKGSYMRDYKCQFEILNAVLSQECMVHLLCNSPPMHLAIQGNSIGILFNGVLAKLPTRGPQLA